MILCTVSHNFSDLYYDQLIGNWKTVVYHG